MDPLSFQELTFPQYGLSINSTSLLCSIPSKGIYVISTISIKSRLEDHMTYTLVLPCLYVLMFILYV